MTKTKSNVKTIKIIAIGGCGCNLANHLHSVLDKNLQLLVVTFDSQSLSRSKVQSKILLTCEGKGSGGDPNVARQTAEQSEELKNSVKDVDVVILVCGLGGGTGSGVMPHVAEVAKEAGATVYGIVITPFDTDGPVKKKNAQEALTKLRKYTVGLKVIENESIHKNVPESVGLLGTFKKIDEIVQAEVERIVERV